MKRILLLIISTAFIISGFSKVLVIPENHNYTVDHKRSTLPTEYDSRDLGIVLPARDQDSTETCWAFASSDVAQILFHKNGIETGYLAPQVHTNCTTGFRRIDLYSGGNSIIYMSLNTLLKGPVYTSHVGEFDMHDTNCPTYDKQDIPGYILSYSNLPSLDSIAIKEAILEYGSVTATFYPNSEFYNEEENFYEYTLGTYPPSHMVNIIGWDDSKRAWLCKNSWGEAWGDKGFIWISYKDYHISKNCTSFNSTVNKNEISNVYTYNTTCTNNGTGIGKPDIKDVPHKALIAHLIPKGDSITYLSTMTVKPNTKVQFLIRDKDNNVFYTGEKENVKYPGLHLHKLSEPVVANGDTLYFEITYTSGYDFPIAVEIEFKDSEKNEDANNVFVQYENQWYKIDNEEWDPIVNVGRCNLFLYVYTKEAILPTNIEENRTDSLDILTQNGLNPEIWEYATQVSVFDISGRKHCTIKQGGNIPALSKGYYVLVVDKKDGGVIVKKINISNN